MEIKLDICHLHEVLIFKTQFLLPWIQTLHYVPLNIVSQQQWGGI